MVRLYKFVVWGWYGIHGAQVQICQAKVKLHEIKQCTVQRICARHMWISWGLEGWSRVFCWDRAIHIFIKTVFSVFNFLINICYFHILKFDSIHAFELKQTLFKFNFFKICSFYDRRFSTFHFINWLNFDLEQFILQNYPSRTFLKVSHRHTLIW